MNSIKVDILNPASLPLLEELAKLHLIAIRKEKSPKGQSDDFMNLVQKIRSKTQNPPSLEEITAEVEQERAKMYAVAE